MENYVERFQYKLQISKLRQLGKDTLKIILLEGIKNEYLEILNLIGIGDVFQIPYDDVCELCIRYSVNTQLKFGHGCSLRSLALLRSFKEAVEGANGVHRVRLSSRIV